MKRTLAMIMLGALPIAMLAMVSHFLPQAGDNEAVKLGVCTGLGALWGLAAGTLRRSLIRAIVGLNAGALCGYVYNATALTPTVSERDVIVGLMVAGAALGAVLNFQRDSLLPAFKGMLAGLLAFGFMGCAAWVVAQSLMPNLFGWTVMCLVPFGGGMAIFIGLVGRESPPASVATHRTAGTVANYDYERGRGATAAQHTQFIKPSESAESAESTRAAESANVSDAT